MKKTIFLIFFLSGLSALIYEVVWFRVFARVLGNSTYSSTVTITAFMLGMALGSGILGKISRKWAKPLWAYAGCEAFLAFYSLVFPSLVRLLDYTYLIFHPAFNSSHSGLIFLRFILSLAFLLPPAFAMGATLPLVGRYLSSGSKDFKSDLALLYSCNTAGAALGGAMTGFVLIPFLGIRLSMLTAALVNLLIAAWAFANGRIELAALVNPDQESSSSALILRNPFPALILFVTSIACMILEIALIRALSLVFGSSVYAFSLTVSVFIASLAFGSYRARILARNSGKALLFLLYSGTASIFLLPILIYLLPPMVIMLFRLFGLIGYGWFLVWQILLTFFIIVLPGFCLGGVFPLTVAEYCTGKRNTGESLGFLYALATAGDVIGTLASGFVFLPLIGMQNTINLSGMLLWMTGFFYFRKKQLNSTLPLFLIPLLFPMFYPAWDIKLLNSAVYYRPERFLQTPGSTFQPSDHRSDQKAAYVLPELLFKEEGVEAEVTVIRHQGVTSLAINGKVDASDGLDMGTQVMLGHLPFLFGGSHKNVLVIGWGSGVTAYSASLWDPEKNTAVEICEEVVQASRLFNHINHGILDHKNLRMVIDDGRNFLAATPEKYDIIISEPTNFWIAGIGSLFTREFFESARGHLKEGGLICQWFHCYDTSPEMLKIALRTFSGVFPEARGYSFSVNDLLVVSGKGDLDPVSLNRAFQVPEIREQLSRLSLNSPEDILRGELLNSEKLRAYCESGPINTDDHPLLEFLAPYSLFTPDQEIIEGIRKGQL
ncbi:MAG: fused MFS/spermidine synthase [Candidatus Wallbacteria bacterium]|nr:fused MFS/spermidine synthase [Candidatus Wallbacteria bacterium]